MRILDYDKENFKGSGTVIALGNFDGFHLGHRKLLDKAEEIAKNKGLLSSVLLFKNHTSSLLANEPEFFAGKAYLSSLEDKLDFLRDRAFDLVFVKSFDKKFADMSSDDFLNKVLIRDLKVRHIVVGNDYHFGSKASGSVVDLMKGSENHIFNLSLIDDVCYKNKRISSTRIRADLSVGRLEDAAAMLGRPYRIRGKIVHGKKRGHLMGFPTANLETSFSYILPLQGVYLTKVYLEDGRSFYAMSSVGSNPTFSDRPGIKIESYIFDFNEDIYGRQMALEFIHYHRENIKFENPDQLIKQLNRDKSTLEIMIKNIQKAH